VAVEDRPGTVKSLNVISAVWFVLLCGLFLFSTPMEPDEAASREGEVKCHERLGGLLKSYYREAA